MQNENVSEAEMFERLALGATLLPPLEVRSLYLLGGRANGADARIELALPGKTTGYRFVVEAKSRSTPQAVGQAMMQAKRAALSDELPMVYVPYLSEERLSELEREEVSGIDLCGNGIVVVPNRLLILRCGHPNRFRDSRPLSNPYRGRSAMVARMLLKQPDWDSLNKLTASIRDNGGEISLPQTSKAIHALEEDRIISKVHGHIKLTEPARLLDKLGRAWRAPDIRKRATLKLRPNTDIGNSLSSIPYFRWALMGESSVNRYTVFSQGGPRRIAVSNIQQALSAIDGTLERIPNFADLELIETDEPGFFFDCDLGDDGLRRASALQTWLELQSGDARQQDAARDIRFQILNKIQADDER